MNAGASSLQQLVFAFALGVPSFTQAQSGFTLDSWNGINSACTYTFQSVLSSRTPDISVANAGSSAVPRPSLNLDNFGMRSRGQLTILARGCSTFYAARDGETGLWLSQDSSRFNRASNIEARASPSCAIAVVRQTRGKSHLNEHRRLVMSKSVYAQRTVPRLL